MRNIISYKGRLTAERDAAYDLVTWFGYKKSMIIARAIRKGTPWFEINIACGIGGASGFPVIAFYERRIGRKLTDADWKMPGEEDET